MDPAKRQILKWVGIILVSGSICLAVASAILEAGQYVRSYESKQLMITGKFEEIKYLKVWIVTEERELRGFYVQSEYRFFKRPLKNFPEDPSGYYYQFSEDGQKLWKDEFQVGDLLTITYTRDLLGGDNRAINITEGGKKLESSAVA